MYTVLPKIMASLIYVNAWCCLVARVMAHYSKISAACRINAGYRHSYLVSNSSVECGSLPNNV